MPSWLEENRVKASIHVEWLLGQSSGVAANFEQAGVVK